MTGPQIFLLGRAVFIAVLLAFHDNCLAEAIRSFEQQEAEQQGYTTELLNKLSRAEFQQQRITLSLSKRMVDLILAHLIDIEIKDRASGVAVAIKRINTDLASVFPRISGDLEITHPLLNAPVLVGVTAALRPEWVKNNEAEASTRITLHVNLLGLGHQQLPSSIAALFTTELLQRLSSMMPSITFAIPREFAINPSETDRARLNSVLSNLEVRLPNGKLSIAITLPALPEIRMKVVPQVFFGDVDGLHLVALSGGGNLQDVQTGNDAGVSKLEDLTKPYRLPPGKDFAIEIANQVLLNAITSLNSSAISARTLKFTGTPSNHILDRTGGAPAGNGFQSWFEGKPTGEVMISDIQAVWVHDTGINLSASLKMGGRAQVHVHGNAPHIPAPRVFGHRIGGGVGVGGGAGTSVGGTLSGNTSLKALVSHNYENTGFLVKLTEPDEVRLSINTAGIVGEVIQLLKVGLKFSVPLDRLQTVYNLPSFGVAIPLPSQAEQHHAAEELRFETHAYDAKFLDDRLEVSGAVEIKVQSRDRVRIP